ncbi:MAG: DNA primase [Bacteroidaceae bacterium]|nr:DNA primase [Bacteroidaceae bacterium]
MVDQLTIEKILDAANIVDVVSEFVTLRRRGVNYVGLCPFHNEKTPSFYVSPSKGICKCFSCGKGGNAIHFLMEHEQMSFQDAAEWLANKYGIPFRKREMTDSEKALQNERESMFITNQFALDFFKDTLLNTEKGRAIGLAYFRKRGFRDDILDKFFLGYCPDEPDALARAALAKGYTKENLIKTGLCYERENDGQLRDRFHGRVIFPVHSISGKVVAFGGRIMSSDVKVAKYVNSPESVIYSKSRELYGLYQAKQAIVRKDRCFLVEGYADVISMYQSGVENVVASSGTSLTPGQIRLIHRFTNNITVLYDGDKAGIKASLRGIDMLLAEGMNVKVLLLPDGEDPDSFAQGRSATEFQKYIDTHQVDFIRFKVNLLMEDAADDPYSRSELIKSITQSISVIQDPIVRSVYITECSQIMKIDERLLINDVNRRQREQAQAAPQPQRQPQSSDENGQNQETPVAETENPEAPAEPVPEPEISAEDRLRQQVRALKREGFGPMMDKERLLSQLIVRYGGKVMGLFENEEGQEMPITVGQFIVQSLQNDGLELRHPVYRRFVEQMAEHVEEQDFNAEKFFMSHPETFVSLTAASLMEERYQLSAIFKDNKPVEDGQRLLQLTRHIMADYQMEVLRIEIKDVEKQMQDPATLESPDKLMELQRRYQQLLAARSELSRILGDRVVNL